MATLTTQVIKRAGITPSLAAAGGSGDRFTPGSNVYLRVKNANASSCVVTVAATGKVDGDIALTSPAVTVAASTGDMVMGPYPADQFLAADGSGLADISYSVTASVTVGVFQLQMP